MVRIPVYEGGVATRPVNQQGVEGRAIEGAFGDGRGLQALAQGMGRLGAALQEVRDLEDMTRAKDAENEFALFMQNHMYGDNGYMLTQGKGAFERRAGFMEEAEKKRRELGARLKGGAAKHYNQASTARMLNVNQQALIHAAGAQKQWVKESSTARQELFAQDALNNVGNREQINRHIAAGILEMRAQAELEGMPAEALAVKEKAYVSGVQAGVVLQLANADPLAAEAYMKEIGNQLEPQTRFSLEAKLQEPVLAAKGKRNGDRIILGLDVDDAQVKHHGGGIESRPLEEIKSRPDGTADYMDVAKSFIGQHEVRDGAALSAFIKRAGGLSIDPRVTPWCAAFVNAVLGAAGVKGTGKLNARSFLNFGQATSQPKIGDIVVLSRGDPNGWQGHVGFFQGYDDKGNVLVLGGNQGDKVSIAPYKADRVLGYRSAGRVDEATMALPNYQIGALGYIEEQLAKIADPREREATRAELERRMTLQKKAIDAAREQAVDWVDGQMETYPQMDLNSLPLEMRGQIGAKAMQALRETQKKMLERDGIVTDDETYLELLDLYADDKAAFAELDLLEYRDKLSNSDWKEVRGWRRQAREKVADGSKDDKVGLEAAMRQADLQLEAIGIILTGKKGKEREEIAAKLVAFKSALGSELNDFFKQNKRKANDMEVDAIINRLALPVTITKPRSGWFSDNKDGRLFEANEREMDWKIKPRFDEGDVHIPIDERQAIYADLYSELGREPSKEEIYLRWFEWKTGIEQEEAGGDDGIPAWRFMMPFPAPLPRPSGKQ